MRLETREDVHLAVDALIQRPRLKLRHDNGRVAWKTLPSLWEMLVTSTQWAGTGEGGAVPGGRPVISTGVVSLMIWIEGATTETARHLVKVDRHSVPANLRALASALPDQDLIDWWTETVQHWVRTARDELHLDPARPKWARGVHCPTCKADHALAARDGETIRTAALAIEWVGPDNDDEHHPDTAWKVWAVTCRACQSVWWRGDIAQAFQVPSIPTVASPERMATH